MFHNARMSQDPTNLSPHVPLEDGNLMQHPGSHPIRSSPLWWNGQTRNMDSPRITRTWQVAHCFLMKRWRHGADTQHQTWPPPIAGWHLLGCPQLSWNDSPSLCTTVLGLTHMGFQWYVWTNTGTRFTTMALTPEGKWQVYYGRDIFTPKCQTFGSEICTMVPTLLRCHYISWHHYKQWQSNRRLGPHLWTQQPMPVFPPVPKPDQTQQDCLEHIPNPPILMLYRWYKQHAHTANGRVVSQQADPSLGTGILTNDQMSLLFWARISMRIYEMLTITVKICLLSMIQHYLFPTRLYSNLRTLRRWTLCTRLKTTAGIHPTAWCTGWHSRENVSYNSRHQISDTHCQDSIHLVVRRCNHLHWWIGPPREWHLWIGNTHAPLLPGTNCGSKTRRAHTTIGRIPQHGLTLPRSSSSTCQKFPCRHNYDWMPTTYQPHATGRMPTFLPWQQKCHHRHGLAVHWRILCNMQCL